MKLVGDVALLRLAHGKVNAIDLPLLDILDRFLDDSDGVGARAQVIIGSGSCFSAGLALSSLLTLDRAGMKSFMQRFSATMLRLYASPRPLVAAINGNALAGGCVLALMADVRIMTDDPSAQIGLDEIQLGLGLPACVVEPLRAAVPVASLAPIALEGRLLDPASAIGLGLVDALTPLADLERAAIARAQTLSELSPMAFSQIKIALRRPVLEAALRDDLELFLDSWFSDTARRRITDRLGSA